VFFLFTAQNCQFEYIFGSHSVSLAGAILQRYGNLFKSDFKQQRQESCVDWETQKASDCKAFYASTKRFSSLSFSFLFELSFPGQLRTTTSLLAFLDFFICQSKPKDSITLTAFVCECKYHVMYTLK